MKAESKSRAVKDNLVGLRAAGRSAFNSAVEITRSQSLKRPRTVVGALIAGFLLPILLWGQSTSWTFSGGSASVTGVNVGIGTTSPSGRLQVDSVVVSGNTVSNVGNADLIFSPYPQTWGGAVDFQGPNNLGANVVVMNWLNTGTGSKWQWGFRNSSASDFANGLSLNYFDGSTWHNGVLVAQPSGAAAFVSGNVGIGTTNPQYLLSVKGTAGAEEFIVTNTGWSDYVFQPGYHLRSLSEVNAYIQANHHLPDIPSEAVVKEKGVSVGEMQAKLLAKVEELTLHMIQQEKENQELRDRLVRLEKSANATTAAAK